MPSGVSLTLTCDALNEQGTFSEGDTVTGAVTLTAEKNATVQTLFVKFKGDASVHWTQKCGDRTRSYSAHRRYFKLKQALIPESSKDTAVPQGIHVYKFSFDIPGNIPPSFKGIHGKIVYKVEVVLSRSWRLNRTVEKEIVLVSKFFPDLSSLMSQQMGSTAKEMGLFSKGHTHMDVITDRRAYAPGEKIMIVAKVNNSSSRDMTPKFSLVQDVVYRANGSSKWDQHVLYKAVGNCMTPQTQTEVRCEISVPPNQVQTIRNCDILLVEYYVKVYLDISFSTDPEVKLPVIILPCNLAHGHQPGFPTGPYPPVGFGGPAYNHVPPPGAALGPRPPGGFGGLVNSDFLPPGVALGPCPPGGFGGPAYSNVPPPGAFGGPVNSDFPPPGGFGAPAYSNVPAPGVALGPCPPGGFGGPAYSSVPPAGVSGGSYAASPNSGYYGYVGAAVPANPAHAGHQPAGGSGSGSNPAPQQGSPLSSPSSSSSSDVLHPPSSAPAFPPPSSAPNTPPPPYSSLSSTSPAPPTYTLLPSAPVMNMDFLSQIDEASLAFSLPPS